MIPNNHEHVRALNWARQAISPQATLHHVEQLAGSTSATLYALTVGTRGQPREYVLRLFTLADWLANEPDLAAHEAANLILAKNAGLPVPSVVAVDETGEHCDIPAVLMTRVPGQVWLTPDDPKDWLTQLAESLVPIHAVSAANHAWTYFTYNDLSTLVPPAWSTHPNVWARAIDYVQAPFPITDTCFIHRDYHAVNVLFHKGRVSGVVDWVNACRGNAGLDLGHCRLNLVGMWGIWAADQFLDAYVKRAGKSVHENPYWDLLSLMDVLPNPGVYPPWKTFGVQGLTDNSVRARLDAYAAKLVCLI